MELSKISSRLAACLSFLMMASSVQGADVKIDLESGTVTPAALAPGITWYSPLYTPARSCGCSRQGVLKLTFDTTRRVRAEVVFTFEAHRGWTFHFGDSVTNNGWAGDYTTQENCAELHSKEQWLLMYGKVKPGGDVWRNLIYRSDFLTGVSKLTVNIADELAVIDNGRESIYYQSFKIFALRGQPDSVGPVNNDIYFGLNRVVDGNYRSGTGLCQVEITWHNTTL